MLPRRTFLALGAVCACVGADVAFGQAAGPTTGKFICPPCGCASDGKVFDAAGMCPSDGCGMALIPQPAAEAKPATGPAPKP